MELPEYRTEKRIPVNDARNMAITADKYDLTSLRDHAISKFTYFIKTCLGSRLAQVAKEKEDRIWIGVVRRA